MNSIAEHLLMHRGTGRTHDAVEGIKNGVGNKVYVCATMHHAMQVQDEYGVEAITTTGLPNLRGTNKVPVFDHFVLGNYIAELERSNQEMKEKLHRISQIIND